jgi:hypothetical protein
VVPASNIPELAPEVASYIAGLIDGEGTITLTRMHANETRRLVVSIANTEIPILKFVKDHVRAGKITNKRVTSDRHTPSFCYSITSTQALTLLQQVIPYLRSYKRHRAALALTRYRALTPRNGKYSPQLLSERHEFEKSFLDLKSVREAAGSYIDHDRLQLRRQLIGAGVRPPPVVGHTPPFFPTSAKIGRRFCFQQVP